MNFPNIAKLLLEKKAVLINTEKLFQWSSGILSPIYCDNRKLLSFPDSRRLVSQAFVNYVQQNRIDCNCIAGVATGAIAWGVLIAEALQLPYVYVRTSAKGHGLGNQVEGILPENAKVLVIEDLISTGGSSIKACDALREADAEVVMVLSIFQYGFPKAEKAFREKNYHFDSLANFEQLFQELNLEKNQQNFIKKWVHDGF